MLNRTVVRSLLRLAQTASQPLKGARSMSETKSILTRSTLLMQDGADITELPLVIRRIGASETPGPASYSGDQIRRSAAETVRDGEFKTQLASCVTIAQVLRLLEVPGETVTARSAAFALQRITQLHAADSSSKGGATFVSKAVLHELCDTVLADLTALPAPTITTLLQSALSLSHFSRDFLAALYTEVETRIGDTVLSIPETCNLIEVLSLNVHSDSDVSNNLWIHLAARYKEVEHNNIAEVYSLLRYLPPRHKYFLRLLDRSLRQCCWKLPPKDTTAIIQAMTLCNHYSAASLLTLGRWLAANLHDITDTQLTHIIAAYDHFNFTDPTVTRALERYVHARVARMERSAIAMVMEYLRKRRILSKPILNAVAADFEQNGLKYEKPLDLLRVLRPYGQLNHLPPDPHSFFTMVEEALSLRFGSLDAAAVLELLASFVYIERFPLNFLKKIFTPHFLAKCLALPEAGGRQSAGRHLLELQAAIALEFPRHATALVDHDTLGLSLTNLTPRYVRFHQEARSLLLEMFGPERVNHVEIPRNTPHLIDFEIDVGSNKNAVAYGSSNVQSRLALVGLLPEHFCANTSSLLGEFCMRRRHLELLGYTVIELHFEEFMWKRKGASAKRDYLKERLSPHVNL